MPERILHIVHTMNRSGVESRIMDLYRNIDRERYQFDFYVESGKADAYDNEIKELGGRLFYSNGINSFNVPNFKEFSRFINRHKEYKTVYAYNQWSGEYLKMAKRAGVPNRIACSRTSIQTKSLKNLIKNIVKKNTNKYATSRFAVSKKAALWLFGKKKVDKNMVNIWPNAIDAKKFAFSPDIRTAVRGELGIGTEFVVMHVGNIRPEKNHSFLLKVFREIKRKRPDSKLILVGRGGIKSLQYEIEQLDLSGSLLYLGVRNDINELLQAADVFVFPSFYEGFPGAVLEAQASGLNCLISDSITDEVMITETIKSMPISDNPVVWAKAIESFKKINREFAWKTIVDAGYDIQSLTTRTESFLDGLAD